MEADHDGLTVAVTAPDHVDGEAWRILRLLTSGAADIVHVRKPGWDRQRLRDLLLDIHEDLHPRLRLHDHFELLDTFPHIGGVHLNSRNPRAPSGARCVSKSCHSPEELDKDGGCDYLFLSPVFDSISKQGYTSAFDLGTLRPHLARRRVIALGGVTPAHFPALRKAGFAGGALLGYIWQTEDEAGTREHILASRTRMMRGFALQFVTDAPDAATTVRQVYDAVAGGCRWVQIRMKDAPDSETARAVESVAGLCAATGTVLLVDDRVHTAAASGASGVHLGKDDMAPSEARKILGPGAIIGCTANSYEDIERIALDGAADYIGLGPFRFTTTKKKLAPVLGLEGYSDITARMRRAGISLPVVAIGGITTADTAPLFDTGIDGVAVSGAIGRAPDREQAARTFVNEIKHYNDGRYSENR